jgi:hypothetical protein
VEPTLRELVNGRLDQRVAPLGGGYAVVGAMLEDAQAV